MSEFDKEAEREKLREQFAEDERERESTQRMSELLLQGATMTNKHCDVHGDPIFRYDGEEFCPTCRSTGGETRAGDQGVEDASAPGDAPAPDDPPVPDAAPDAARASEPTDAPASGPPTSIPETPVEPAPDAPTTDGHDAPPSRAGGSPSEPAAGSADRSPAPSAAGPADAAHTDLADARASLARTVTRFADEAERADDLARSREYLAAAEDAASALAAVRDAEK